MPKSVSESVTLEVVDSANEHAYGESAMVWKADMKDHKGESTEVALKITRTSKYIANPPLRHEACVLLRLADHPGIPKVYALGRSKFHEYIAIQLLGNTLEICGSVTVVRDLAALACQMLKLVKHVHFCNLIHGNIKPQNFVFGREDITQLYLIDYGLATWHTSPRTNDHVESRNLRRLQGTPKYCSIRMHLHKSPSRADDMESLAYTIIHILLGTLPWDSLEIDRDICVLKQLWSGPDLCAGYPALFGEFLDDARHLQFQDQPNYDLWIERFQELSESESEDASEAIGPGFTLTVTPKPNEPSISIKLPPSSEPAELEIPKEQGYLPRVGLDLSYPRIPTTWDQIEKEKETVRQRLAWIERIPGRMEPLCDGEEKMVTQEEEDSDEENYGKAYLEKIDEESYVKEYSEKIDEENFGEENSEKIDN